VSFEGPGHILWNLAAGLLLLWTYNRFPPRRPWRLRSALILLTGTNGGLVIPLGCFIALVSVIIEEIVKHARHWVRARGAARRSVSGE
jgi:hypothetical protein